MRDAKVSGKGEMKKGPGRPCTKCAGPLRPGSRFCPTCGASTDTGFQPPAASEKRRPSVWLIAGGTFALAAAIGLAVVVTRSGDDPSAGSPPAQTPTDDPAAAERVADSASPPPPTIQLTAGGITPFAFGAPFESVEAALRRELGPPDADETGPDDSLCPARTLRWGALRVSFRNAGGTEPLSFSGWGFNRGGDAVGSTGPDLETDRGIALGTPRGQVEALLPPGSELGSDFYSLEDDLQIGLTDTGPRAVVDYLGAGFNGCVE